MKGLGLGMPELSKKWLDVEGAEREKAWKDVAGLEEGEDRPESLRSKEGMAEEAVTGLFLLPVPPGLGRSCGLPFCCKSVRTEDVVVTGEERKWVSVFDSSPLAPIVIAAYPPPPRPTTP